MNQEIKKAIVIIASLPKEKRQPVLALTRAAGNVFDDLRIRRSFPASKCKAYQGKNGDAGGKPALQDLLIMMGAEFSGGTGGRGNEKIVSLKKP